MGGNALKAVFTRRYKKEEYHDLCSELLPVLKDKFDTDVCLVESFKHKETFGDMDILVKGLKDGNDIIEILNTFSPAPTQINTNSNVVSFEHREFQIDLIFTKEEEWESSKLFFKYGDMGNLLGKMYHKINLKYGFSGLVLVVRDVNDTRKIGQIIISTEGQKIFEFMGLSWDRYLEGFNNEQEIFDYIIQSRFFDPEAFKFENLNHINKKRNRRREGYKKFVNFVEDMEIKPNYTFDSTDKIKHIKEIETYFGYHITEKIKEMQNEDNIKKEIASKFNGRLVMEWGNIEPGISISKHIKGFRDYIRENRNYEAYILMTPLENIKSEFLTYLNK